VHSSTSFLYHNS